MSDIKLSKLLIIDCEMTCDDKLTREEQSNQAKIIEIGVTEIDTVNKKIIKTKSWLINQKDLVITDFCTKLTGITHDMIKEKGVSLAKASKEIRREFGATNCYYGAWGTDNTIIEKEFLNKVDIAFPFNQKLFINFQNLYSMKKGIPQNVKLKNALESINISFEGRQHRAGDDSYNTALLILKEIL